MPLVHHLVRDDEVVLGVHRRLNIVANDAGSTAAGAHGAGIRIGQRHLVVRGIVDLLGHALQELHLIAKTGDLLPDLLDPLGNVAVLTVGAVEGGKVAIDARLDLLDPLCRLVCGVIAVPIVHCFELAAVDSDNRLGEQAEVPAQHDELAAYRPDRWAVVRPKVRDGFEVRSQPSGQPYQLDLRCASRSRRRLD